MKKAILTFFTLAFMSISVAGNAGVINIGKTGDGGDDGNKAINSATTQIKESTFTLNESNSDIPTIVKNSGFGVLSAMKLIISSLIVAYLVYNGALMIMANGSNDDALSRSKRQFIYAGVGLLFINIPGTILSSVFQDGKDISGKAIVSDKAGFADGYSIFLNDIFGSTIQTNIIGFLQVIISAIAILGIILSGIRMLTGRGNEEKMSKLKSRVIYSGFALVFVGIMEGFKQIVFTSDFTAGKTLFDSLANLALYFAAPVAITFIIYAGYQLITSNGDEQKMNNAKTIVTNVLLAVLIVLSSGAILAELNF